MIPLFRPPAVRLTLLLILLAAGLAARCYRIDAPPLDFHTPRQYRALTLTRALAFPEKYDLAATLQIEPIIEPPITEVIVAGVYRLTGHEALRLTKAVTITFWLVATVFLYLLARRVADGDAALIATGVFLFLPYSVTLSRSFQPESLLIMTLLIAIYCAWQYFDAPSAGRLLALCVAAGVSVGVKGTPIFFLAPIVAALAFARDGFWPTLRRPATWLIALCAVGPFLAYFVIGRYAIGFIGDQEQGRFLPHLLLTKFYWTGLLRMLAASIGFTPLMLGLTGALMAPGRRTKVLVAAWLGAHALYLAFFGYHAPTHDYYQLPLIPLIAIGVGVLATAVGRQIVTNWGSVGRLAWYGLLVVSLGLTVKDARWFLTRRDYADQIAVWERIGAEIPDGAQCVWVASNYGLPLRYHGGVAGRWWPSVRDLQYLAFTGESEKSIETLFDEHVAAQDADFFIVAYQPDFDAQPELKALLDSRYPLHAATDDYRIYDLRGGGR